MAAAEYLSALPPQHRTGTPAPHDPVAYVLTLNLDRRHLSPTQRAMVGARAREYYDREAKKRQQEGQERGRRKQKGIMENFPQSPPLEGTARDQAGKAVGVSGKLIDMASRVLDKGTPELIAAVDDDITLPFAP